VPIPIDVVGNAASKLSPAGEKVLTGTSTAGLLNVGPGSNPPGALPDATKGDVTGVWGFVGPLIEHPQQASSPPGTCGVFGQCGVVESGVFGPSGVVGNQPDPLAPVAGVLGYASANYGVLGVGPIAGVQGMGTGSGAGVAGHSPTGGDGVFGVSTSKTGLGVRGLSGPGSPDGPFGINPSGCGVFGESFAGHGVCGANGNGSGKSPPQSTGVWGDSEDGIGVYGASKHSFAGQFDGNHTISGNADVGGNHTVKGNAQVDGDHTVKGNVTANDVTLVGKDCAEAFDIGNASELEPGTVVVFNSDGNVVESAGPYDKRVAGVISGAGKYHPGIVLGRAGAPSERTAPVALVGRVYCKADASYGAIEIGDMLTTSPTYGFAMRASDPSKAFGAVIGKALAPLDRGQELIPILVALK
jgi:hypothetical protein